VVEDIFELTVKITDAHDQQVDWPARLLNDTRTVPILHYSCRPDCFDSFKVIMQLLLVTATISKPKLLFFNLICSKRTISKFYLWFQCFTRH